MKAISSIQPITYSRSVAEVQPVKAIQPTKNKQMISTAMNHLTTKQPTEKNDFQKTYSLNILI